MMCFVVVEVISWYFHDSESKLGTVANGWLCNFGRY